MSDTPTTGEWIEPRHTILADVYETPPSKDHPTGTTWKQVAEWNGIACVENQKLLARAQADLHEATKMLSNYSATDEKQRAEFYARLNKGDTTALDAAIASAKQPLVELLDQVLSETVDTPTYPDGPCLDAETRRDIKAALAKVKERK